MPTKDSNKITSKGSNEVRRKNMEKKAGMKNESLRTTDKNNEGRNEG